MKVKIATFLLITLLSCSRTFSQVLYLNNNSSIALTIIVYARETSGSCRDNISDLITVPANTHVSVNLITDFNSCSPVCWVVGPSVSSSAVYDQVKVIAGSWVGIVGDPSSPCSPSYSITSPTTVYPPLGLNCNWSTSLGDTYFIFQ